MARIKTKSIKMLSVIADYRLMSATQLSVYFGITKQAVWNNIRKLHSTGAIKEIQKEFGRSRGRPEAMYGLTELGVQDLRKKGILNQDPDNKFVLADNLKAVEHQILLNWFRLHLAGANRQNKVLFEDVPTNSSLYWKDNDHKKLYYDCQPFTTAAGKEITLIPDLAMRTIDRDSGKSLLFFVEIDRGTENLKGPDRTYQRDITGKIINYMYNWGGDIYKLYEQVWKCKFNGFRVLFVANTPKNCTRLCDVVSNLGDLCNFVWITDIEALFDAGIGSHIWYAGGVRSSCRQSILDSLAFDSPIANIKYNSVKSYFE